ncbi:MAG TPA: dickkopf-related protein, partial [Polyangiales bacterium]|nr:dickkopf-related protein [Polyangiales bacterium]
SQISIGIGGQSFALMSGGPDNPTGAAAGPRTAFGALYPDGSKYLATSVAMPLAHADIAQALGASTDAALYDTATGNVVPDTGVPVGAMMPMYSPDGTQLVFNDIAINSAHGLALMDYDVKTDKATNYKMLASEVDPLRPGWPFFLPDGKAVVYVSTDGPEFDGNGAFIGAGNLAGPFSSIANLPIAGPNSDLKIVDTATGTANVLARAMGFNTPADAANDATYLPFGMDDIHHSYFPTVSAVAAGGYFWVFFDSIRHYGNLGLQRQLWGAAIDISADGSYKLDPSHPAFYLPGQEFGAGNHRAFAALDPCKKDGDTCSTGIDCCGGFCYISSMTTELVTPTGTCSPKMNTCAKTDERCTTSSDCCPPTAGQPQNSCIAGFCAIVQLN